MIPQWKLRADEQLRSAMHNHEDPLAEEHLRESLSILLPTKSTEVTNFTRKYKNKSEIHQILDSIKLPGNGHGYENCGKDLWMQCRSKNHDKKKRGNRSFKGTVSCNCRGCPICKDKWAWKIAGESACRLWMGARIIQKKRHARWFRFFHVEVSYLVRADDTKEYLDEVTRDVLKSHCFDGGNEVFHPTKKDSGTKEYTVQDGTYHHHSVALIFGKFEMSVKGQTMDGRDYIFKVNPDPCGDHKHKRELYKSGKRCECKKHYTGIKTINDIRNIIHYEVGHAGFIGLGKAVKYWGEFACNMLPMAQIKASNPLGWGFYHKRRGAECPHCGSMDTGVDYEYASFKGNKPPPWDPIKYEGLPVIVNNEFVEIIDCRMKVTED